MSNIKRLERSRTDRIISGVCGGIARQFNFDTVVVRLVFVIIGLIPGMLGFAAIAYVVAIFLIPEEPETGAANTEHPGWRYDPWTGDALHSSSVVPNDTLPEVTAVQPDTTSLEGRPDTNPESNK